MNKQSTHPRMASTGVALFCIEAKNQNEVTISLEPPRPHYISPCCTPSKVSRYGRLNIKIWNLKFFDPIVYLDRKLQRFHCWEILTTVLETIFHISEPHQATMRFTKHASNPVLKLSLNAN
jgi:hypothetical protein